MKKIKEERASIAVYVLITLLTFSIILTAIYFTLTSTRKTQLLTILKIKESYEKDNVNAKEIYEQQLLKQYVKDGLILYYDAINNRGSNEDHSTTAKVWKDLSGNENNGTIYGDPIWEENSLTFDGIDDYISIEVGKLNSIEQGTIIIAGKLNNWGNENSTLLYKGNGEEWNSSHIRIARNGTSTLAMNTAISNNKESTQSSNNVAITLEEKMQIAMSWNGTTLKNYKNGALNNIINTTILPAQDSTMCYIGKGPEENTMLNGSIYAIYIYNRELSEEEIQQIYTQLQNKYEI